MKVWGLAAALVMVMVGCVNPIPLTATVETSATQNAAVGGRTQLLVKLTNTGPAIPHLGLVFRTADRWYEHHTVTNLGGCAVAADASAFDCGDVGAGATASFLIVGTANEAGAFHYELALRELVRPFDYVNERPDGADTHIWDETVTPK
jgi:hypothetical protein